MVSKLISIAKIFSRDISLTTKLCKFKNKNRKLRLMTSSETVKTSKAMDLKASKNRSAWENAMRQESQLAGKVSSNDVYFINEYERKRYPIYDAILNYKEICLDKSMLDCASSVLTANFTINMKTKKATKFIQKLNGVVLPAHELTFLPKPKILAFCMSADDIGLALASGAYRAGDDVLVKQLETGQIHYEEFDQVVSHTDALPLLGKLKPILKEKFPLKTSPRVGDDVAALVDKYVNGFEFETRKLEGVSEQSYLTVPLGEISWPQERLVDNFLAFLQELNHVASTQIIGDPVSKVTFSCLPCDEEFLVDLAPYLEELRKARMRPGKSVKADNTDS